jgi:hypothetical protein
MAVDTSTHDFEEILEATEQRYPAMTLNLEIPYGPRLASDCRVEVILNDSLTCAEIGRYYTDPLSALNLLGRAMRFAIDGELEEDEGAWKCQLFDHVQAWAGKRMREHGVVTQERLTCKLSDVIDFTTGAMVRQGYCDVQIDQALWRVIP